ncbi:MAG: hypothetical protein J6C46_10285 [Clostridia bacterium]|nr:hypothetical protein [Clostridia bacterium]
MLKTRFKKIVTLVSIVLCIISLAGCNTKNELVENDKYEINVNNKDFTNGNDETKENSNNNEKNDNSLNDTLSSEVKYVTVADIKSEYDTLLGVESKNQYMFKPFYNVEQTTEFTFSFKSKVDPIKAITVHTDEKCDYLSLVFQINNAYWTEDGIDVIVKPSSSSPVLYAEDRENVTKGIWGYAPIYYLCIRYDLESTEVKKLENPIIIPFTVKNEISTPTVYANIDNNGIFSIKWNKVENATKYKVYSAGDSRFR